MRDFGIIRSRFWSNADLRDAGDRARLLAAYLLTGPHHNAIGCYRCPVGYIQADLGWERQETVSELLILASKGFLEHEISTDWVFLPSYLIHNPIHNPNIGSHVAELFRQLPKNLPFYHRVAMALLDHGKHLPKDLSTTLKSLVNGSLELAEPMGERERERERQREDSVSSPLSPLGVEPKKVYREGGEDLESLSVEAKTKAVFEWWQAVHEHPRAKLDSARRKAVAAALDMGFTVAELMRAVSGAKKDAWLMGRNDRNQVYDDLPVLLKNAARIEQLQLLGQDAASEASWAERIAAGGAGAIEVTP